MLVEVPGCPNLDVPVGCEQSGESILVLDGEQGSAVVQDPARLVERVGPAVAVAIDFMLDTAPAPVQGITAQTHHVERVHRRDRSRDHFGGSGLEAREAVRREDLDVITSRCRSLTQPRLERSLGTPLDQVQEPRWAAAVTDRGQANEIGYVLVAARGMAPDMLVDPEDLDTVEMTLVVDQDPLVFGQDGVVGGLSSHR